MTQFKNTFDRYGLVAILFHWVMAIIVITMVCLGLYMTSLPSGPEQSKLIGWHKGLGVIILGLILLRLLWRLINITPMLPNQMPSWEKWAARIVHWSFYIILVIMPISGWIMSSAAGYPVSFFGLFTLPNLVQPDENLAHIMVTVHNTLAFTLIGLIILHVAAALKHYLIDKDDVFQRML